MLAPTIVFSGWATNSDIFYPYKKLFSHFITYHPKIQLENRKKYIFIAYSMGSLYALNPHFLEKYCQKIIIFSGFLSFINNDTQRKKNIQKMISGYHHNPIKTLKVFYKNAQLDYPINKKFFPKNLEQLTILENKAIEHLTEQKIPLLNIFAKDDIIVPYKQSQKIKHFFPNSQEIIFPTGGHGIILNQQKKIYPIINNFLNKNY